jgi:hypothetical protein
MTAVEWERRWARLVAIAAIAAAFLFLAGVILQAGLVDQKDDATQLTSTHDHSTALLGGAILLAVGAALFSAPLYYLLRAAKARNKEIRSSMLAFAFIGPILLGVRSILGWIATHDIANQFIAGSNHSADTAKHLIDNSSLADTATALGLPAVLGLVVAMIYIPMMAMRVGLIPRFWGTLGMALGVGSALLGLVAFVGLAFWFAYVGFLIGGWLKAGRPPAWDAGEAIPWPPPEPRGGRKDTAGVVEGDGTEIDVGPDPAHEPDVSESPAPDDSTESQGQRRKARKRRG